MSWSTPVFLCGYDNVTFFWGVGGRGEMPDMPHSFGCEATDWLRGIWFSCKRFCTWSQCCHFGWSLRCSDT